jgi:hypothetical protein
MIRMRPFPGNQHWSDRSAAATAAAVDPSGMAAAEAMHGSAQAAPAPAATYDLESVAKQLQAAVEVITHVAPMTERNHQVLRPLSSAGQRADSSRDSNGSNGVGNISSSAAANHGSRTGEEAAPEVNSGPSAAAAAAPAAAATDGSSSPSNMAIPAYLLARSAPELYEGDSASHSGVAPPASKLRTQSAPLMGSGAQPNSTQACASISCINGSNSNSSSRGVSALETVHVAAAAANAVSLGSSSISSDLASDVLALMTAVQEGLLCISSDLDAAAAAATAAATTAETGCQTDLAHLSPAASTESVGQVAALRGLVGYLKKQKACLVGRIAKLRLRLGQVEGQSLAAEVSRGSLEGEIQSLKALLQFKSEQVDELSELLLMAGTDNCQDDLQVTAAAASAAGIGSNGGSVNFYSARSSLSDCDGFGDDEGWSSAVSDLSSPHSNSRSGGSMCSAGSAVHSSNSNGGSGDSVGSALPSPTSRRSSRSNSSRSRSSRSSGSAQGLSMGAVIALCFACLLLGHVGVLQPVAVLLSGVREGGWAGGHSVDAAIIQGGSSNSMDGFAWGASPWDAGQRHSAKITMTLATRPWHNHTAAAAAHALAASAPSWRQYLLQDTTAVLQRLTASASAQLRSWGVSVGLSRLSTQQYSPQYSLSHEVDAVAESLRGGVLQWQAAAQAAYAAGDIWSVQQQLSNGRTAMELLGRGTCTCLRALQDRMQSATAAAADGVARNSSSAAAGQTAGAVAQQTSCPPNNTLGDLLQQIAALPPSAASVSCAHNPNAGFERMLQQIAAAGPTEAEVTCAYSSAAALTDMLRAFAAAEAAAGPQSRHDTSAEFERMLRHVSKAAAERAAWEAIPEVAAWLAQEAAAKAYANSPWGRVMTALRSLEVRQRVLFRSRVKSLTCFQDTCAIEHVY